MSDQLLPSHEVALEQLACAETHEETTAAIALCAKTAVRDVFREVYAPGPCAVCGRNPAAGWASIGDEWFCHGDFDPEPTCYMRSQSKLARPKDADQ